MEKFTDIFLNKIALVIRVLVKCKGNRYEHSWYEEQSSEVKIYLIDAKWRYKTTDVSALLPPSGCLNYHVK